ncbi:MAG TPA: hypothetical protein DDY58_17265 [Terrisporobacter glycolicus]|uniref:phage scaffolding protein n=2 Tax=Terrisporobacter TaxID=1505652 RepID=UPI000E891902|nr:phage scaffolding protein [Terrisporobacter hibernicus]HBI94023.1 hypothetical protein [Terrisporobacter hibernicus]
MKLIDILKAQGLTDEQISKITASMKENKVYETSLENADERYSKMKGKKEEFEGQLKTANDTIADLKKNNTDNETLQNTIKDHEATIATLQKEAETKDFNYALDAVLKDNKCKNSKALKALLNMEGIKLNEGKFEGLEEQLKTLKESDSYLFDAGEKQPGGSGFNPDDEVDDGKNESIGTRLGKQAKESKNTFDDNPYFKI